MKLNDPDLTVEDALFYIHAWLLENKVHEGYRDDRSAFTLSVPGVMMWVERNQAKDRGHDTTKSAVNFDRDLYEVSEPFYEAAWELCRRGILRPALSLKHQGNQGDREINHYSVTGWGWTWLEINSVNTPTPIAHGRFAELLKSHVHLFGKAYETRSLEALNCYRDGHFLASCVMCGASSESILLALSSARFGEDNTYKAYRGSGGCSRVMNNVLTGQNAVVRDILPKLQDLLQYWRTEAAHGLVTPIDEAESYTSLVTLLKLAEFVDERWVELTSSR